MQNFSNLYKNKIKQQVFETKNKIVNSIPKNIFDKCPTCSTITSKKELNNNLYICPKCSHHLPTTAKQRIEFLIDEDTFIEYDKKMTSGDPLGFEGYRDKIKQDIKKTKMNEAVMTGEGKIDGIQVVVGVMDSHFRMGSMGSAVGEKITRAIEKAIEKRLPFILFSASGGARMQEGVLSLMQMAKTSAALEKLNKEGLLFVSYLTHPTTGGVSASFASLGDINIAEPNATIGFAGRRIIEQTIRQKLPDNFQTSEFLLTNGQLDMIVPRKEMKSTLSKILSIHTY